jgi:hypothetical protein
VGDSSCACGIPGLSPHIRRFARSVRRLRFDLCCVFMGANLCYDEGAINSHSQYTVNIDPVSEAWCSITKRHDMGERYEYS